MENSNYSKSILKMAEDNHKEYLKRLEFYRSIGIDNEEERKVIGSIIDFNPQTILEIGTGKGYLTVYLAKKYKNVVTVDIDKQTQEIAKLNAVYEKSIHNIDFMIADAENIPFEEKKFDLVISAFAFHHINDPQIVFNEMIRVSKKYVIIAEFNERGFELIRKAHKKENRVHEEKHTDLSEFIEKIDNSNLKITKHPSLNQVIYLIERTV